LICMRSKIAAKRVLSGYIDGCDYNKVISKYLHFVIFVDKHNCMRKSKSIFIYVLFIFIVSKSLAQDQHRFIGIKGGICIPNLTARGAGDNPLNIGYSSRLGPDIAIFLEQPVTQHFSILPSLEYSSQGGKKKGFQPFPFPQQYAGFFPPGQVPTYLYANFKNDIQLNYLLLNVLAKFNWYLGESSPLMMYAEVGPFGAYLVSAKDITSGSSLVYADEQKLQPLIATAISFDNKMDAMSEVHKGNLGIAGDIGLAVNFSKSRFFMEAGGNYGLLNIQKDAANGKNQIGAVIGRIGYAFSLGTSN